MTEVNPTLLIYVVSPVHFRNSLLFLSKLQGWECEFIYYPEMEWFSDECLSTYPYHFIPFKNLRIPDKVWNSDIRALIMSTAQVNPEPFHLLLEATKRNIPVIAIEEVYQLSLWDKKINNYMLPVDELLVASEEERDCFISLGGPPDHIHATGWPFCSEVSSLKTADKRDLRKQFGIDDDRPVATLILSMSALSDAISSEGPEERKRILSLVAEGLPEEYHLLIKAHPCEDPIFVTPYIKSYAPRGHLLDRYSKIGDVLAITNILLN